MAIEGGKVLQKRKDGEKDPTPEIESALRRAIEAAGAPAPKWVFESHASGVDSVALSRDGHWLVIASRDGEIRLWDLKQDRPSFESLRINKPPGQPLRTAISLDGGWLVAVAGRMPILYDLQDLDRLPRAPVVLEELGGATVDLTFSPTSNRLAIADDGGTVRVWELGREGRPAARPVIDFAERGRAACDLAFSYDGRHLASGDTDGRTRVWDLEAPARAPLILGEQVGPILDVDFAGDGRVAAVGGDNRIALWNLHAPGRPCLVLDPPSTEAFTAVEFDPEGRWMASGTASGSVFLWDLGGLKEAAVPVATLRGLPGLVTDLVFSKDVDRAGGLWLAAATSPGASGRTSALWDVSAAGSAAIGAPCLKLEGGAAVVLAFESAGDWLALGGADGAVRLYDLDGFNPARRDEVFAEYGASRAAMAHEKPGRDLAISPDGASLAVAGDDGRVGLWSIDKPSTPPRLLQAGSGRSVRDVAFSPDGRWLAAWSVEESAALGMTSGCAVLLCDLRKGSGPGSMSDPFRRDVGRIDAPELPPLPHSLAFAPGGGWFASGGGEALLWDLAGADPAKSARPIAGSGAVASLDFSPDGRWLAVGDLGGIVTLYGGRAGWGRPEQGRVVTRHGGAVIAAMFTPDGRLITAGRDGTVRLLPAAADGPPAGGGALPAFDLRGPIESVAMGVCQGRPRLAVGDLQGRIYLFDLGPQDSSLPIPDPAVGSSGALALAFSPDGSRLATGRENGLIDVYALDEGGNARELVSFQHERALTSLTFSADGRRIVSASADGTVRTWPLVPSTDLLKLAETLAQRNPTADEWKRYIDANFQDFHKTAEKLPVHPSLVASVFQLAGEGRTKEARDRLRMLRDIDPGLAVTEDHLDAEAERARVRAQVQQVRTQLRRVVARLAEEVMGKVDVARGAGPVVGNDAAARARESQELARYLKGFHLDADYIRRQQALAWVEQALALELRRKHHDLALMFYERASERDPKINLDLAAIRSRLADSSRRGTPLQLHESGYQSAAKGDVEEAP